MTSVEAYEEARTFKEFLKEAEANKDLWQAVVERVTLDEESVGRIVGLGGHWRLLVLADDWCGDAVNTVPVIAGLAEEAPNLELRILGREEIPEIMDAHLTRGSRSIPIAILLGEDGRERGWWGPRPRELQEWFENVGRGLDQAERYPRLRRWYAGDRGVTTCREIADLVQCGAEGGEKSYEGTQPCEEVRAA